MKILEIIKTAYDTLTNHKIRSILTTLGVIIGVMAVLANVGALEGLDDFFQEEVEEFGANFVIAQSGDDIFDALYQTDPFPPEAYNRLQQIPRSEAVRITFNRIGVDIGDDTGNYFLLGVSPTYFETQDVEVVDGEAITDDHIDDGIVLTESIAKRSFDRELNVNDTVELEIYVSPVGDMSVTQEFTIVGIIEDFGEFGEILPGFFVHPETLMNLTGMDSVGTIGILADSVEDIDFVQEEVEEELRGIMGEGEPDTTFDDYVPPYIDDLEIDVFGIGELEEMVYEGEGFAIVTQKTLLGFVDDVTETINMVSIAIAGISLLVGGIGIANIMLVTVTERTREIGLMKAVGAKNNEILSLFIVEAGIIGLIGGIIGLILGVLFTYLVVPIFMGLTPSLPIIWIFIATGISFLVGILSGIYPAVKASKMDPVEALSYE